eukprot:CAMPEP_0170300082 /NCGR_PEP_ID=MMETSP0116_2-20130129/50262_1 /TAXON_ID=400756 /ORGANISM="Durinskia baltica, Strain CSIRO CS-38" /LENGTH=55 /DNA_ID=CAMNT_0010551827 /DNA_START=37 /DNA_END=204 /DNA_ORIENTATION=+
MTALFALRRDCAVGALQCSRSLAFDSARRVRGPLEQALNPNPALVRRLPLSEESV